MKDFPLVSICIPTYNAAVYLEPCLLSAVQQTYTNLEIIVCDDASNDNTIEIVKAFQQQHPQIKLVQNNTNLGMVNNWNQCIKEATGEWIKLLFQDDLLESTCVEEMLAAAKEHDVEVALCSRTFLLHDNILPRLKKDFGQGGIIKKAEEVFGYVSFVTPEQLAITVKHHLIHNVLGEPPCYLFHRNLYKAAGGFNPHLSQLVDYEFIIRLGLVNGFAFLPKPLVQFRVHQTSQSSLNKQQHITEAGDMILLQHQFLYHPGFAKLRAVTGKELLETNMKHIYYSTCKHKGEKRVNEGLAAIRKIYPAIGTLTYNFFNYAVYRHRMKKWYRVLKDQMKKTSEPT